MITKRTAVHRRDRGGFKLRLTMYFIISDYDVYLGDRCLIRAVPWDILDWAMLKREGLTAKPCEA